MKKLVGLFLFAGVLLYLASGKKNDQSAQNDLIQEQVTPTEAPGKHTLNAIEQTKNGSTESGGLESTDQPKTPKEDLQAIRPSYPEYVTNFYQRFFVFEDSSAAPSLAVSSIFNLPASSEVPSKISDLSGVYIGKMIFPSLGVEESKFSIALRIKSKNEENEYIGEADIAILDPSSKIWRRVASKEPGGTPGHMAARFSLEGKFSSFIPQMILPEKIQAALHDQEQDQAPPEYSSINLVGHFQNRSTNEKTILGDINGHRTHLKDPIGKFELAKQD